MSSASGMRPVCSRSVPRRHGERQDGADIAAVLGGVELAGEQHPKLVFVAPPLEDRSKAVSKLSGGRVVFEHVLQKVGGLLLGVRAGEEQLGLLETKAGALFRSTR